MKRTFQEINIEDTINSGQVFLWEKKENEWYGINGQNVLVIDEKTRKFRKKNAEFIFSDRMIILRRFTHA